MTTQRFPHFTKEQLLSHEKVPQICDKLGGGRYFCGIFLT